MNVRRPQYAVRGDVGEGEVGSESNEQSCGLEDDDGEGDDREAR